MIPLVLLSYADRRQFDLDEALDDRTNKRSVRGRLAASVWRARVSQVSSMHAAASATRAPAAAALRGTAFLPTRELASCSSNSQLPAALHASRGAGTAVASGGLQRPCLHLSVVVRCMGRF